MLAGTTGPGSLGTPPDRAIQAAALVRGMTEAAAAVLAPRLNRPKPDVAADLLRLVAEAMMAGKQPEAALETAKRELDSRALSGIY